MYVIADFFNHLVFLRAAGTPTDILRIRDEAVAAGHRPQWLRCYHVTPEGECTFIPVAELRRMVKAAA